MLCALLLLGIAPAATASAQPAAAPATNAAAAATSDPTEGSTEITITKTQLEDPIGLQLGSRLVVGNTTPMSGHFFTDMWGTNTADMDVRALLHAYETVSWTRLWSLEFNGAAVENFSYTITGANDHVYTLTLADDMFYSDGTPITARDYAFSLLLAGAPEVASCGATPAGLSHIEGYDAYQAGETNVLSGVKVLDDYTLQIRVRGTFMPYFYGLAMVDARPYPITAIAPGCEVRDDGQGVYIAASDAAASMDAVGLPYTPGQFSVEMMRETLLNPETGYLYNPKVTSGPYMLRSYDPVLHRAEFEINPYFKGDHIGRKPHIEELAFWYVKPEEALDQLASGEIDLINKSTEDDVVNRGMEMAAQDQIRMTAYPRSGLAFLAFACENGPTASVAVRQAIAKALDKEALMSGTLGTTATRVDGYYGVGQWMVSYEDNGEPITGLNKINVPLMLEERRMVRDVDGAKRLLSNDGWKYNANGEPFTEGVDTMRHRKADDGTLEPLLIKWVITEDNATAADIRENLMQVLPELGIKLEVTEMPFDQLLTHYYRQTERVYNMFFMATNFNFNFDPYYYFHADDVYQGMLNTSGIKDEQLMRLALDMRETGFMDVRTYVQKWIRFQDRFQEVLPMVPLYSNTYYDFYRNDLNGYNPLLNPSWAYAVLSSYLGVEVDINDPLGTPTNVEGVLVDGQAADGTTAVPTAAPKK